MLSALESSGQTGETKVSPAPGSAEAPLPLPLPSSERPAADSESSKTGETKTVAPEELPTRPPKQGPDHYEKLTTRDGGVYKDCQVIRADPAALLVKHTTGMARLSFFDLSEEVQAEWGFDPFLAMKVFKAENERERALRWRLFWERQQYESDQARQETEQRLRDTARREWIPVEATVLARIEDEDGPGFVAECWRVTFRKTKTRSTLGFEIDGPPKRVLMPLREGAVILRPAISSDPMPRVGGAWSGYVDPDSEGKGSYPYAGAAVPAATFSVIPAKKR